MHFDLLVFLSKSSSPWTMSATVKIPEYDGKLRKCRECYWKNIFIVSSRHPEGKHVKEVVWRAIFMANVTLNMKPRSKKIGATR